MDPSSKREMEKAGRINQAAFDEGKSVALVGFESCKRKGKADGQVQQQMFTMNKKMRMGEGQSKTPTVYFINSPFSHNNGHQHFTTQINALSNNSHLNHDHQHYHDNNHLHRNLQEGRPESKENFAIHHQQMSSVDNGSKPHHHHPLPPPPPSASSCFATGEQQELFSSRDQWIPSILVATYLIEVTVQIFLIIQCCRSIIRDEYYYGSGFGLLVISSSLLSSFLVTLVSILWVFRGMDFSGRVCGRLLCYVMHSFLLGLLWRYLKLAFAFDKADLEEFFRLKKIQSYIQSLPLVTIHLAWVFSATSSQSHHQQTQYFTTTERVEENGLAMMANHDDEQQQLYGSLSSWLVVVELLSAVISLLILPTATPSSSNNKQINNLQEKKKAKEIISPGRRRSSSDVDDYGVDGSSDNKFNNVDSGFNDYDNETDKRLSASSSPLVLLLFLRNGWDVLMKRWNVLGRGLVLIARLLFLGMFLHKMSYYWITTGFITFLHFAVSFAWLTFWAVFMLTRQRRRRAAERNKGLSAIDVNGGGGGNVSFKSVMPTESDKLEEVENCDNISSKSSSNDSGLVDHQSEIPTGVANFPGEGEENIENGKELSCNNNANEERNARGVRTTTNGHVFPNCFSIVIHRRNMNMANSNKKKMNDDANRNEHDDEERVHLRQTLLTRVLPLTYVLFWDVTTTCFSAATSTSALSRSDDNKLNLWANTLPVLLSVVENIAITIYHWRLWYHNETNSNLNVILAGLACLCVGWLFIGLAAFQKKKKQRNQNQKRKDVEEGTANDNDEQEESDDSGYERKEKASNCIDDVINEKSSFSKRFTNENKNKETGEELYCLSLCCSSLSHNPLKIKRKSIRDSSDSATKGYNDKDDDTEETNINVYNFCKTASKNIIGQQEDKQGRECRHHLHQQPEQEDSCQGNKRRWNEYEEQQHLHNKNQAQLSTNVNRLFGEEGKDKNDKRNECSSGSGSYGKKSKKKIAGVEKSMKVMLPEFSKEDAHVISNSAAGVKMNVACARAARSLNSTPVTKPNYTNIKEALTRRISSKSCRSSLRREQELQQKSHYHPHQQYYHHHPRNCMNQETENNGNGEYGTGTIMMENDAGGREMGVGVAGLMISSFKSSSSTRLHPTVNSKNKCTPISIKSPLTTWQQQSPEEEMVIIKSCSNDSSGSSSSNSRNTNTVHTDPSNNSSNRGIFYCPVDTRKCIDFDNDVRMIKRAKETGVGSQRQEQQQHQEKSDFSVVFFEEGSRGGRMEEARVRTPVASGLYQHDHRGNDDHGDSDPIELRRRREEVKSRLLRNQITGKTYLSDGASLTSLDGLCEIRASTPVEIKKASKSRVIVNYPPPHHQQTDTKTVSRCSCGSGGKINKRDNDNQVGATRNCASSNNNSIYEKLMEDPYGILICEGENSNLNPGYRSKKNNPCVDIIPAPYNKNCCISAKLKILCAKCLQNHDPLLTNCVDHQRSHFPQVVSHCPKLESTADAAELSESTDYPSDTEFTVNNGGMENDDVQSLSTHFSSATYNWHHKNDRYQYHQQPPTQLSQFIWAASSMIPAANRSNSASAADCPKEFTSLEYVRTWLMASHPKVFPINGRTHHQHPPLPPSQHQQGNSIKNKNSISHQNHSKNPSDYTPKHKSTCDKPISKKKRFLHHRHEKRERPIGRGASPPPAKDMIITRIHQPTTAADISTNLYANTDIIPVIPLLQEETVTTTCAALKAQPNSRLEPPPSRKQHPLLFYDMMTRPSRHEELQRSKPLLTAATTTPHKKCRDQLDLFHKELETVV